MPQHFVDVAERIVDALLEADPSIANYAGDHRFDDRLPDLSRAAVDSQIATLKEASHVLSQVDSDTLAAEERVDHALLSSAVDARLFGLTEVREHEWNPLRHNPGELLYALVARPFAPVDERLTAIAARLEALPDALATARAVLSDMPAIHVETAVVQFSGVARLIRGEVAALTATVPALRDRVTVASTLALAALEEFLGWLRERLAVPGRDPRLGRQLWEAKLWHTLDTELSAGELMRRAEENLERVSEEIRRAAVDLLGGVPDDASVRAALGRLAAQRPDDSTIVRTATVALDEATAFVAEHGLVSLVDDPLEIQVMPEFARGVAAAYCDPPGPLETADVPTFYAISPTPAEWPPQRVESFYREYNDHMVRNMTVHEAMPGHFLQLAHARRFRGTTRVRALCWSGPFVEGWAVYAEELMVARGFGGLPVRLQQLKMQLRMTINAILDQLVHCEGLTEAEGMRLMTERGFQEEGEAAGKWRRALLTSTQLSTYFVGYTEVSAIAAGRPDGTGAREWHDGLLAHGSPSPRHLSALVSPDEGAAG